MTARNFQDDDRLMELVDAVITHIQTSFEPEHERYQWAQAAARGISAGHHYTDEAVAEDRRGREKAKQPRNPHYVNGEKGAPQIYELRMREDTLTPPVTEQSEDSVDLMWKARRFVNGHPARTAVVEAVSGFYSCASFTDASLHDWERAGDPA